MVNGRGLLALVLQVGFLAFQRSDGTLDDAAAIRALTQA